MNSDPRQTLQIGEVAEEIGLSLRTIRHYEEVGLVPPSGRTAGGFRLYTQADVERLRVIMHMKPMGFSLEEMRQLLDIKDRLADADDAETPELLSRLGMFAAQADARCEKLRGQLQQAEIFARSLHRASERGKQTAKAPGGVRHPATRRSKVQSGRSQERPPQ